jgi:ketosteroid isomerase-like protein
VSQDNTQAVRELWRTWVEDQDVTQLGDLTLMHPEVQYEDDSLPDHVGEVYVGHDGLRRAWARFADPWMDFEVDLEWVRGTGDKVVSYHLARGRGRGSGVEMRADFAYLWTFREGRVVRLMSYGNPADALEAAGLSN